ncbi:unnamed protein product [Prunus armeniaca]
MYLLLHCKWSWLLDKSEDEKPKDKSESKPSKRDDKGNEKDWKAKFYMCDRQHCVCKCLKNKGAMIARLDSEEKDSKEEPGERCI